MPLVDFSVRVTDRVIPQHVRTFLREAQRRVERFCRANPVPAFIPSDFRSTYRTLDALAEAGAAPGDLFCEWGSGLGVVACLASMLGFDARGIEIEPALVDAARQLADDFDLPVEFAQGSFIPPGGGRRLGDRAAFAWLSLEEGGAHEELGLEPDDFAVVFAYPWPDEECWTAALFAEYARTGAVLVTHHSDGSLRLRQCVREGP